MDIFISEEISLDDRFIRKYVQKRRSDWVRTGRASKVLGPPGFVEGVHEVFPLPLSEIDVSNGAIQQNNGY